MKSKFCSQFLVRLVPLLCLLIWRTPTPAAGIELEVYILSGQSNLLGTTGLEAPSNPGAHPADALTSFFWSNVDVSNTVYPPTLYGDSGGAITTLQTQQGDGGANPTFWGPEFGMARRLFDAGRSNLFVIKASRGGGGNTLWDEANFDANNNSGHMWGHLRDTVDAALGAIGGGNTFKVKGFMYLQGESNSSAEAAIADTRLNDLINNLQTHINTAYPNAADNMHTVVGEIAASGANANRIQTTQLQTALAAGDLGISFVATNDLPLKSDGIHFGRDAKLTIGERFADVLISVSELPNGVVGDVNQDGSISTGSGDPLTDDVTAFVAGWQSDTFGMTNLQKTLAGDLNLSGKTTLADAFILHRALETQGLAFPFQSLTSLPEPNSTTLLAMGVILMLAARKVNCCGCFVTARPLMSYRANLQYIVSIAMTLMFCAGSGLAQHSAQSVTLPAIDLASQRQRQVVVDREAGQYLGHPTTVLLEDNRTIIAVYPKGHGRGAIVMKRSDDAGLTWSGRLKTPESWSTSKEVPTIHRVVDAAGKKRLILWSGLYPARLAVSENDGQTWSELEKVGDWGGIVVMGFVEPLIMPGHYLAMFHDDGQFFTSENRREKNPKMTLYQTRSIDGGLTWSMPVAIWSSGAVHLCEPGCIRSPDGNQLAVLLRENSRRKNSHVIFSDDEGASWTEPREIPLALTGDRHTGKYAPDGRLLISVRCISPKRSAAGRPFEGDWVAWVGTYDDIADGRQGQYSVRIADNTKGYDTAYPGVEILPDGTFVLTTYGHWAEGEAPYILSVRLKLSELDELAGNYCTD